MHQQQINQQQQSNQQPQNQPSQPQQPQQPQINGPSMGHHFPHPPHHHPSSKPPKAKSCYLCGEQGHTAENCSNECKFF